MPMTTKSFHQSTSTKLQADIDKLQNWSDDYVSSNRKWSDLHDSGGQRSHTRFTVLQFSVVLCKKKD
jgi:hypothetical protein